MSKSILGILSFLLLPILWHTPPPLENSTPPYLTVTPKPGDGILSVLRRYHLADNSCDVNHFYEINNIKQGASLYSGRRYKLPLFLYPYDGTSIRSTIGINDWDKAIRIQKYNDQLLEEGLRTTRYNKGKKILWVPYREIYCDGKQSGDDGDSGQAPATGPRVFPIFGKKYEKTPLKSSKLKGKVYYVVGGHGGPDSGAVGKYGNHNLCEDEYAYDVALRLCRKLLEHGAIAYMITRDTDGIRSGKILPCDRDETSWKNQKMFRGQKARLTQRSSAINRLYDEHKKSGATQQQMVAIHIDSRSVRQSTDVFFYYYKQSKAGKKLAYKMHQAMKDKYAIHRKSGKYSGTVSYRDLHMLRETKPTSVYIELGNIRNPNDQKRFILESNREALAKWLFEGMTGFVP